MSNIAELFFRAAEKHPHRVAIHHIKRSITYGELARQVRSTAAYFLRMGLLPGDRVLVVVPMGVDLYRIVLALFSIGAGAVFLDAWVSWKRMELCCGLAQCKGFVGGPMARALGWFSGPVRRIPVKLASSLPPEGEAAIEAVDPDTTALITFTTGSTGTPKAARRSHGTLAAQFDALLEELEPSPEDVVMTTLPIVLFMGLGTGCTSVVPGFKPAKPVSFNGGKVAREMERRGVSRLIASPAQVNALADHMLGHGLRLPALKMVFTGGAPVFPRDAERMCAGFGDIGIRIVFGSTECEPISSISAADLLAGHTRVERGLCVGAVFHRTGLRIIRITDRAVPQASMEELDAMTLGDGSIGEIIVSGDHVLRSYFNGEEAFRRNKIVVGGTVWHRTGDSGFIGREGLLFLTGRCARLIDGGDRLISPFVWEDKLCRHKGVLCGTVIDRQGALTAIVQAGPGVLVDTLYKELLAAHSELGGVEFIRRMPMDPRHQSKIDHEALRTMLAGQ